MSTHLARRNEQSEADTDDSIIKVLKEIDSGASIALVDRLHGISDQTICCRSAKLTGMSRSELTELQARQEENRRHRHIVSKLSREDAALNQVAKRKT
jgi:AraC-like DNA-binding protein